jgi:drug/metabolite transporter (DMT)-like permease
VNGPQARPILHALVAIALWATMATLIGRALEDVSALRLLLWSQIVAAAVVVAVRGRRRPRRRLLLAPARVLAVGLLGILLWPLGLVVALEQAPLVPANLITYLWPLLIVLMAPLAGERFRRVYLLAAVAGFGGALLLVTGHGGNGTAPNPAVGYAAAVAAAIGWAVYSVSLRRRGGALQGRADTLVVWTTAVVFVLAAVTGDLAPPDGTAAIAALLLGLGPLSLAFLAWERAVAHTDVARLGVLSYFDPLASTLLLAVALSQPMRAVDWLGMACIIAAAAISELPNRQQPARARTAR